MLRPVGGRKKVARKLSDSIENIDTVVLNVIFLQFNYTAHCTAFNIVTQEARKQNIGNFLKNIDNFMQNNEKYDNSGEKLEVGKGCHVFQDP